ncbi:DUF4259 domain-containing protein [Streptomyces sp. NPDC007076]|uniref:DUF4259 domain-containing protein n=1 Tax=unclassified Streptomyces TaxID=2593676 RepID=UPI002E76F577|nr:DUF4259 domain-containing protein [Streptomyces sp. JV190]MEE1844935.1 DUF4259 domain-containing protein [Streptomyces sp. JV190]
MGTWDTGHFDNDTAADFSGAVDNAPEAERAALLRNALTVAIEADYLDSDEGAPAVAAAALIAAQCPGGEPVTTAYGPDKPLPTLPAELRPLAVKALDAVLGENSELRELWDDAGDKEWAPGIARLREVLVAASAG